MHTLAEIAALRRRTAPSPQSHHFRLLEARLLSALEAETRVSASGRQSFQSERGGVAAVEIGVKDVRGHDRIHFPRPDQREKRLLNMYDDTTFL